LCISIADAFDGGAQNRRVLIDWISGPTLGTRPTKGVQPGFA
jgi:hypothetical protein